jgi:hypothetical protein
MKKVTTLELAQILQEKELVQGIPTFATVEYITDAKLKKTNNPYLNVYKQSRVNVLLNSEYKKAVTNQLIKENKDTSEYKQGKNTMPIEKCEKNNFFGYYEGKPVIEYRPNDKVKPTTIYLFEGNEIEKEKIAQFLPTKNKPTNQGTERVIPWNKLYLDNIISMSFDGEKYEIVK